MRGAVVVEHQKRNCQGLKKITSAVFLNNKEGEIFALQCPERLLIVSNELVNESNTILHNPSPSGGAIPGKTIASAGNGVLSSRSLE